MQIQGDLIKALTAINWLYVSKGVSLRNCSEWGARQSCSARCACDTHGLSGGLAAYYGRLY